MTNVIASIIVPSRSSFWLVGCGVFVGIRAGEGVGGELVGVGMGDESGMTGWGMLNGAMWGYLSFAMMM